MVQAFQDKFLVTVKSKILALKSLNVLSVNAFIEQCVIRMVKKRKQLCPIKKGTLSSALDHSNENYLFVAAVTGALGWKRTWHLPLIVCSPNLICVVAASFLPWQA